jgi:hypothetical protein
LELLKKKQSEQLILPPMPKLLVGLDLFLFEKIGKR